MLNGEQLRKITITHWLKNDIVCYNFASHWFSYWRSDLVYKHTF